jgi:hypothetical protein
MTTLLGFQQQSERRVAFNIDPLDWIHLDGDFQAHDYLYANKALKHFRTIAASGPFVAGPGGRLVNLPKLSIAARLYTIFALMAATTLALSAVAVSNAHRHAALTEKFESANAGSWNVERINGLIYASVMESRGIYMSADRAEAGK